MLKIESRNLLKSRKVSLLVCSACALVCWSASAVFVSDTHRVSFRVEDPRLKQHKDLNSTPMINSSNTLPGGKLGIHEQSSMRPEILRVTLVVALTTHSDRILPNPDMTGQGKTAGRSKVNESASDEKSREENFYRKRDSKVNPYIYDVTMKPEAMCKNETVMVILIHSDHPNFEKRSAIRDGWGSVVKDGSWPNTPRIEERMELLFVVGIHSDPKLNEALWEEHRKYNDVVQGNFRESYRNLTLKSLLGLKLVAQFCRNVKYLLKTDDDVFVNIPYLLKILKSRSSARSITGHLVLRSSPMRGGKWRLTEQEFPFKILPMFTLGAAYVITSDLFRELLETSEYVPWIHIDDLYVTGFLARILKVNYVNPYGFVTTPQKTCDVILGRSVVALNMYPQLMKNSWSEMSQSHSTTCAK